MATHEMKNFGFQRPVSIWRQSFVRVLLCAALLQSHSMADVTTDPTTDLASGTLVTVTDLPDDAELVTDFLVTTEPEVPHRDTEVRDERREVIEIRIYLTNFTFNDVEEEIGTKLTSELNTALTGVGQVEFEYFSNLHKPPIRLVITLSPTGSRREEALRIIYNRTTEGSILAGFPVENLEVAVENASGDKWRPLTYCYIKYEVSCASGMNCTDSFEEEICSSVCNNNKLYCQNGGSCERAESVFIKCNCQDGYIGDRCESRVGAILKDLHRYILIAIAGVVAFILLLVVLCCMCRKCRSKRKSSRGLYGVENVVALHSLRDETDGIGGVAIQTDDSFLLNLSNENGVPPKAGYTHKIMQTNESFLLTRSQNPKIAQVRAQPSQTVRSSTPNSSVPVNGSSKKEPKPTNNNPAVSTPVRDAPKLHVEMTAQTGGSLSRNIVKV